MTRPAGGLQSWRWSLRLSRKQIAQGDKSTDQKSDKHDANQSQPSFDEIAYRLAELPQKSGQQVEANRATDDRCEAELDQVKTEGATGNRHNLVRDWSHALQDYD